MPNNLPIETRLELGQKSSQRRLRMLAKADDKCQNCGTRRGDAILVDAQTNTYTVVRLTACMDGVVRCQQCKREERC